MSPLLFCKMCRISFLNEKSLEIHVLMQHSWGSTEKPQIITAANRKSKKSTKTSQPQHPPVPKVEPKKEEFFCQKCRLEFRVALYYLTHLTSVHKEKLLCLEGDCQKSLGHVIETFEQHLLEGL